VATVTDVSDSIRRLIDALDVDPSAAATLGGLAHLTSFGPGDMVIEHHAVADAIHFLVEGTLRYEHLVTDATEQIAADDLPLMPVGWSALHHRRYRATAVAETDGTLLTLPLERWDTLATTDPALHARLADFVLRAATRLLALTRNRSVIDDGPGVDTARLQPAVDTDIDLDEVLAGSPELGSLPAPARAWLVEHIELSSVERGDRLVDVGEAGHGLWLLVAGRVRLLSHIADDLGVHEVIRHTQRPGSLLAGSTASTGLPAPHRVEATRSVTVAHVPRGALADLLRDHPELYAAIAERQLRVLRSDLLSARAHFTATPQDGGIATLRALIDDGMPLHPADSTLNALPDMFGSKLTRRHAFDLLYATHRQGTEGEREVAGLAIDLFQDFERGHRFTSGIRSAYDGVVRNNHLPAERLRKISTRLYRDALSHLPYVIGGWENLPDDPNCVFIFNHMAYADESILPNGFLYNPDSHLLSGVIVEAKYGDSIRIARTNARTEFWRADYYEPLGHIGVVTPESGWIEETPEEKAARKAKFWTDCEAVLASGRPLCIAPEGTITEEDSVTERTPGPLKPGAFLMSGRLPSRPRIVPVAMANFDKPAHTAFFSAVIKPSFTMEERGVDTSDRAAMAQFLEDYRREFRGHVEEAIALARSIQEPGADRTGLVSNIDDIDPARYEYEHDVRALEARTADHPFSTTTTVFYGSSTFGTWEGLGEDVGVPDALNLGFGGATLQMATDYFHRLVVGHSPARLVVYCGENDLERGVSAAATVARFQDLAEAIEIWLPKTDCWFVSIKTGPALDARRHEIEAANTAIAADIGARDQWQWLDWASLLRDADGRPDETMFTADGIHVNTAGYDVLARLLRDALAEEH
jgi:CRP-like cAMP-binding protein/lysophospholipase L1-like esterase